MSWCTWYLIVTVTLVRLLCCLNKGNPREFLKGLQVKREELTQAGVAIEEKDYLSVIIGSCIPSFLPIQLRIEPVGRRPIFDPKNDHRRFVVHALGGIRSPPGLKRSWHSPTFRGCWQLSTEIRWSRNTCMLCMRVVSQSTSGLRQLATQCGCWTVPQQRPLKENRKKPNLAGIQVWSEFTFELRVGISWAVEFGWGVWVLIMEGCEGILARHKGSHRRAKHLFWQHIHQLIIWRRREISKISSSSRHKNLGRFLVDIWGYCVGCDVDWLQGVHEDWGVGDWFCIVLHLGIDFLSSLRMLPWIDPGSSSFFSSGLTPEHMERFQVLCLNACECLSGLVGLIYTFTTSCCTCVLTAGSCTPIHIW